MDIKTKLIFAQFDITFVSESQTVKDIEAAYSNLAVTDRGGYIAGVAAYYDPGSYYAGVEYAEVRFDGDVVSLAEDDRLATLGYRYNEFTLHYSYSSSDKTNDLDVVPTTDTANYAKAKGVTDSVLTEDKTHIVGLRYDFHSNAALKFEYEH